MEGVDREGGVIGRQLEPDLLLACGTSLVHITSQPWTYT